LSALGQKLLNKVNFRDIIYRLRNTNSIKFTLRNVKNTLQYDRYDDRSFIRKINFI